MENVLAINFTPKSIGKGFKSHDDWFALSPDEQERRCDEGRRELRQYIKRMYGRVGFILELHDDPAPDKTHGYVSFAGWNLKLKQVVEEFSEELKKRGYQIFLSSCSPKGRVGYHSAVLEYFPKGGSGRADLKIEEGLFILKELINLLKLRYLS